MVLHQLKINPEKIKNELDDITDKDLTQHKLCTLDERYYRCLIKWIIFWIALMLIATLEATIFILSSLFCRL